MNWMPLESFCKRVYAIDLPDDDIEESEPKAKYVRVRGGQRTSSVSVLRRFVVDFQNDGPNDLLEKLKQCVYEYGSTYRAFLIELMEHAGTVPLDSVPVYSDMEQDGDDDTREAGTLLKKANHDAAGIQALALVGSQKALIGLLQEKESRNAQLQNEIVDLTRLVTQQEAEKRVLQWMLENPQDNGNAEMMKQGVELLKEALPYIGPIFAKYMAGFAAKREQPAPEQQPAPEPAPEQEPSYDDPGAWVDKYLNEIEAILQQHPELITHERIARIMGWQRFQA